MRYMQTLCAVVLVALTARSSAALTFNFNPEPGMDPVAIEGFRAAGALWSEIFNDDMTVNMDIGFRDLGAATLAETGSEKTSVTYQQFRTAMTNDRSSDDDTIAVASLTTGTALAILLNRTSNNPAGPGSALPFLDNDGDANNSTIELTRANAKALGLLAGTNPSRDANITFNNQFNFDFDPSDGIDPTSLNFVFVAAHEIGHALGFVSGVDLLEINSPPEGGPFADNQFVFVSSVDVFRFSTQSVAQGAGTIDWTADTRRKFFSTEGGATDLGGFSTGVIFGDGQQNSHWKDNLNLGIMDPTAAPGEAGQITLLDRQLFDVIGYNPEPQGIVSRWPGNGNAIDIVGGNDGTLQGGTTFAPGRRGQAFSFDGVDDFVSIPFNQNYNFAPNGQFSIEGWIKPGRIGGFQAIVVRDVFEWDWGLWQSGNRFVTGHHNRNLTGQIEVQVGTWVHVAVTYDAGIHKLYVNGVLDTLSGQQSPITQSNNGLALGRRISIVGVHYQGLLDEVAIFDRALSQSEIQAIVAR